MIVYYSPTNFYLATCTNLASFPLVNIAQKYVLRKQMNSNYYYFWPRSLNKLNPAFFIIYEYKIVSTF